MDVYYMCRDSRSVCIILAHGFCLHGTKLCCILLYKQLPLDRELTNRVDPMFWCSFCDQKGCSLLLQLVFAGYMVYNTPVALARYILTILAFCFLAGIFAS